MSVLIGKWFQILPLAFNGNYKEIAWFVYHATSHTVPDHGSEWGCEVLHNGQTIKANGFPTCVSCLSHLADDMASVIDGWREPSSDTSVEVFAHLVHAYGQHMIRKERLT